MAEGKKAGFKSSLEVPKIIVNVRFFTTLREITGKKEEKFDLEKHATVENALDELSRRYGQPFIEYVFEKGEVKSYLQILVDGRSINLIDGIHTRLKDGNVLAILPPAGGG